MTRSTLPQRRPSENEDITFAGVTVNVTIGDNDIGMPMEVFCSTRKIGTMVDTLARDTAVLMSLCLQYGCTPRVIARSLTADEDGRPEGLAGKIVAMLEERSAQSRRDS